MNLEDLFDAYHALCQLTDNRAKQLENLLAPYINCRSGCHTCCTLTSVLPLEAHVMQQALTGLDDRALAVVRKQALASSEYCPLLLDGLCVIYEHRPLICRTHGVPIAYIDYELEAIEVSACPQNFPADFKICQEHLFFMDEINRQLLGLNHSFTGKKKSFRKSIRELVTRTLT